jgi:Fic family protein
MLIQWCLTFGENYTHVTSIAAENKRGVYRNQKSAKKAGDCPSIHTLMLSYKRQIRGVQPKLYSQDLINNLFRHPCTRVAWLQKGLSVTRLTATKYLYTLVEMELFEKVKKGRRNYYLNPALLSLLAGEWVVWGEAY